MRSFDDFDAWNDCIRGAELRTVCDRAATRRWSVGGVVVGAAAVQVAEEGGGNLAFGRSVHPGPILFIPLSRVGDHVVNGEALDDDSLLLIPPFSDFRICVRRHAHAWLSVALPPSGTEEAGPSRRVVPGARLVGRVRSLALAVAGHLAPLGAPGPAHDAAGGELIAAAGACIAAPVRARAVTGRPRYDRADVIRRMMDALEATAEPVHSAGELARAIGVHDRLLQRAVRETWRTTTKDYLLLRSLHAVRRTLTRPPDDAGGVTEILARHGVWEFGRFAGRYRRHFGELPSETLRRARG